MKTRIRTILPAEYGGICNVDSTNQVEECNTHLCPTPIPTPSPTPSPSPSPTALPTPQPTAQPTGFAWVDFGVCVEFKGKIDPNNSTVQASLRAAAADQFNESAILATILSIESGCNGISTIVPT